MTFRLSARILASYMVAMAVVPVPAFAVELEPDVAQTPPAIRVVAASRRELVETLSVTGTIRPRQEAVSGTDLGGLTIVTLEVEEGDTVSKDEVLARLDRSALEVQRAQVAATVAQAKAALAQATAIEGEAEVGLRQAREQLERAKALEAKGVAAQSQLDSAVNNRDAAEARLVSAQRARDAASAQIEAAEAQRRSVELQLDKTAVKAPADGLVLARSATLGSVVSPAAGPLFRIAINGDLELVATVAEISLPRLAPGMAVTVNAAGATPARGSVDRISPEIDPVTRLGKVHVTLPRDAAIRPGNFARADIELARRTVVAVPAGAVVYRDRRPFLQLVEDGRVRTVPVELGMRTEDDVEIVSGLSEGQEVVARAGTFVADGDQVTPVRDEATGATPR